MWIGMGRNPNRETMPSVIEPIEPRLEQILAFCAEDPVERVFLEDVARRRLGRFTAFGDNGGVSAPCHVGANVVPAGAGCRPVADVPPRGAARLILRQPRAGE